MLGVAVGTAALIITLSVFNGLEGLLKNLYDTFDPEIKIVPAEGKTFVRSDSLMHLIKTTEGVLLVSEVIEDNVLIRHQGAQVVGGIKRRR